MKSIHDLHGISGGGATGGAITGILLGAPLIVAYAFLGNELLRKELRSPYLVAGLTTGTLVYLSDFLKKSDEYLIDSAQNIVDTAVQLFSGEPKENLWV